MTLETFTVDASARMSQADIWFALPAGFVSIPLENLLATEPPAGGSGSPEDPRNPLGTLAGMLSASADAEELVTLLAPVQRFFQVLALNGVVHCSLGLHCDDDDDGDGQLLPSFFTLAWRETAWAPRQVNAARAATATDNARHVELLDLPCGPASLVETHLAPQFGAASQELLQFTVFVPYPDARKLAVLTLSTAATHRADHYRNLLRGIAQMVTFENPFPVDQDEE
jgi:hypothetical protein